MASREAAESSSAVRSRDPATVSWAVMNAAVMSLPVSSVRFPAMVRSQIAASRMLLGVVTSIVGRYRGWWGGWCSRSRCFVGPSMAWCGLLGVLMWTVGGWSCPGVWFLCGWWVVGIPQLYACALHGHKVYRRLFG